MQQDSEIKNKTNARIALLNTPANNTIALFHFFAVENALDKGTSSPFSSFIPLSKNDTYPPNGKALKEK